MIGDSLAVLLRAPPLPEPRISARVFSWRRVFNAYLSMHRHLLAVVLVLTSFPAADGQSPPTLDANALVQKI
jgi:hypothetical protein